MTLNNLEHFDKNPAKNYVAFKTPSLRGEHSDCGAKEWQYNSLWDSYINGKVLN